MMQHPHPAPRPPALGAGERGDLPRTAVHTRPRRVLSEPDVVMAFVAVFGMVGALAGLIVGLIAYVPTAPVAMIEAAAPASALGALLGGITIGIRAVHRRLTR